MEYSKFFQYCKVLLLTGYSTSLHFRSFIMSNIAYSDYIDSKKVRDEISNLLVAIGKGEVRVSPHDKKELYNIKDVCVKTTKCL